MEQRRHLRGTHHTADSYVAGTPPTQQTPNRAAGWLQAANSWWGERVLRSVSRVADMGQIVTQRPTCMRGGLCSNNERAQPTSSGQGESRWWRTPTWLTCSAMALSRSCRSLAAALRRSSSALFADAFRAVSNCMQDGQTDRQAGRQVHRAARDEAMIGARPATGPRWRALVCVAQPAPSRLCTRAQCCCCKLYAAPATAQVWMQTGRAAPPA